MKHKLWTPTLAWMAAVAAAVLLALFAPELSGAPESLTPHDVMVLHPRSN
jgi:hypothetical protein